MVGSVCVIASGYPHHITQRYNRRRQTLFRDQDALAGIDLMTEWRCKHNGDIGP